MNILNYFPALFFGLLPSFLWLAFYLRKDPRPEPRLMILKVFFYGMQAAVLAFFLEIFLEIFREELIGAKILPTLNFSASISSFLEIFFIIALVEEFSKFFMVKIKVFDNPELDEPVDAMIYMITAGLGFAASENILFLFPKKPYLLGKILQISAFRFIGATLLHALTAGIIGFFIGLSFFRKKERAKLISCGLILATLLHGVYDFNIIKEVEEKLQVLIIFFLLILAAIFVSFGFKRLKK